MRSMNVFRILGDVSHTLSKCILIYSIHSNSSAEGVSLITQFLYCLVFIARYLDLFQIFSRGNFADITGLEIWNFVLKIFYILSSLYIIFLMMRVYARTREREKAWKFGSACLAGSAVLAPFVMMIFRTKYQWGFMEAFAQVLWVFSIILESVCVLPQLLLLRQTTVPTVFDSFYLLTLGSYRAFYILNWIWRGFDLNDKKPDPISVIFGVIQTVFYIDFFWVYYSRQRIKLRHGGIVDQDDLRKGWILGRIFGNKHVVTDEPEGDDEEAAPALGGNGTTRKSKGKWGARGISVSADEGVLNTERQTTEADSHDGQEDDFIDTAEEGNEDAKMRDPDELAKVLEDDDYDDDILPGSVGSSKANKANKVVGNGDEWND